MKEIWELVDEQGNLTGILHERGVPVPKGLYHLGVEIWTKVGDKLFTTKRHPDKWEGGKWEANGGSAVWGEQIIDAAVRELCEETGISVAREQLTFLGAKIFGNFFAHSYILHLDTLPEITLQDGETVEYRLVSESEFEALELTYGTRDRFNIYRDKIFEKK